MLPRFVQRVNQKPIPGMEDGNPLSVSNGRIRAWQPAFSRCSGQEFFGRWLSQIHLRCAIAEVSFTVINRSTKASSG
jgi:hypothetical protein